MIYQRLHFVFVDRNGLIHRYSSINVFNSFSYNLLLQVTVYALPTYFISTHKITVTTMMMSSPYPSNNNRTLTALIFQDYSPLFFTVELSTNTHCSNKRKHSTFAIEQQSEELYSQRARSVQVGCKRKFNNLYKHESYRNKEEEAAEEEPALHSPSKQRRATLLSKRRVFVFTPSSMKNFNPSLATIFCNHKEEGVI